jgi:hypothetical protein
MCDLCRRSFMRGTAALLGAGALPTPLLAQAQTSAADSTAPAPLPARGDLGRDRGQSCDTSSIARC